MDAAAAVVVASGAGVEAVAGTRVMVVKTMTITTTTTKDMVQDMVAMITIITTTTTTTTTTKDGETKAMATTAVLAQITVDDDLEVTASRTLPWLITGVTDVNVYGQLRWVKGKWTLQNGQKWLTDYTHGLHLGNGLVKSKVKA